MTSSSLSPAAVLELAASLDGKPVLKLDIDNTKKNKDAAHPTYYIPVKFNNESSGRGNARLKFASQLVAGNAKIPYGKKQDGSDSTDVRLTYRRLTKEDLLQSDYKESDYDKLLNCNGTFVDALDCITQSFDQLVKEIKAYEGPKFKIECDPDTLKVYSIKQSERKALPDDKKKDEAKPPSERRYNPKTKRMKLEQPFYRFKLGANPDNKKIGRKNFQTKKHEYIVYDVRHKAQGSGTAYQPAKIRTPNGEIVDLTVTNVKNFITYLSSTAGMVSFEVCLSQSGISLLVKVDELFVSPHKPMKRETLSESDLADMVDAGMITTTEDMVYMIEEQETKAKPKASTNRKPIPIAQDEEQTLDEPDDNNYADDADEANELEENKQEAVDETKEPDEAEAETQEEQELEEEPEPVKKPAPKKSATKAPPGKVVAKPKSKPKA
jgi:hypothetical protein